MNFAAVILAAGMSRRMGVLKPLLPVGKQSAVARCLDTLRAAGIRDIFVVTGYCRGEIETAVGNAPGTRCVNNPCYAEGMFTSVLAGVGALPPETDGFFLLPADCCAIQPATLTALMSMFAAAKGNAVIHPARGVKRGHPPLIPWKFMAEIAAYEGREGMKGYLAGYPAENMQVDDAGVLLDMDTPEDYAALLGYLGLPVYPAANQCARLLAKYRTPPRIVEHGRQVAALAEKIALLLEGKGARLNIGLLRSACLLHDMVRQEPDHAGAGAKLLLREGYPAAAILVGGHMDAPGSFTGVVDEMALLYLADKLCRRGEVVRLEETLDAMRRVFAGDPEAIAQATRRLEYAEAIMEQLCTQYGVGFEDINA